MRFLYRYTKRLKMDAISKILVHPPLFHVRQDEATPLSLSKDSHGFELLSNRFALYGPSGIVSPVFNDRLITEDNNGAVEPRNFVDIFQSRLHHHYFQYELNTHTMLKEVEFSHDSERYRRLLFQSARIPYDTLSECISNPLSFIPYRRLFMRKHRNTKGLRKVLADYFSNLDIKFDITIETSTAGVLHVAPAERTVIGRQNHILGLDTKVGEHFKGSQGPLRLRFSFLDSETFFRCIYHPSLNTLAQILHLYLGAKYPIQLEFINPERPGEVYHHQFHAQLGVTTWLWVDENEDKAPYYLERTNAAATTPFRAISKEAASHEAMSAPEELEEEAPVIARAEEFKHFEYRNEDERWELIERQRTVEDEFLERERGLNQSVLDAIKKMTARLYRARPFQGRRIPLSEEGRTQHLEPLSFRYDTFFDAMQREREIAKRPRVLQNHFAEDTELQTISRVIQFMMQKERALLVRAAMEQEGTRRQFTQTRPLKPLQKTTPTPEEKPSKATNKPVMREGDKESLDSLVMTTMEGDSILQSYYDLSYLQAQEDSWKDTAKAEVRRPVSTRKRGATKKKTNRTTKNNPVIGDDLIAKNQPTTDSSDLATESQQAHALDKAKENDEKDVASEKVVATIDECATEKTPTEKPTPKKSAPKKSAPKKPTPKKPAPKKSTQKKSTQKDAPLKASVKKGKTKKENTKENTKTQNTKNH